MPTPPNAGTGPKPVAGFTAQPDVEPRFADAMLLQQVGRLGDAFALFQEIVAVRPDHAPSWHQIAIIAQQAGHSELALTCAAAAAEHAPEEAAYHNTLGALRLLAGDWAGAEAALRAALAVAPGLVAALSNLGNALKEQGRFVEAVAHYQQALNLDPRQPQVWNNLGTLWPDLNRLDEAERSFKRALALAPDYAEAHNNLGVVLKDQGRVAESAACFRQALALRPGYAQAHSNLLFTLCFDETVPPEAVFAEHQRFETQQAQPFRRAAGRAESVPAVTARAPERCLRIGYVSPDFRMHPGGHFLLPLITHHDPASFEVVCYSGVTKPDALTAAFRVAAPEWRETATLTDLALARLIREDRIDLLVECTGHMQNSRILTCALKPAPVQISYPLYPNTTGLAAMDYRIADPIFAPPGAEAWASEALVRLPEIHVVYQPSAPDTPVKEEPPCLTRDHLTLGSYNNFAKVGEATVAAWARILHGLPEAKLRLKWSGLAGGTVWCQERFARHGIGPERLILANPAADPYTPYHALDFCLDPLHANGGTTTCDALWMGVPVVSCCGATPFSRVGLAHLTAVGLPELVASTVEDYVALAVALGQDRERLIRLRQGLRARFVACPSMDAPRYTRFFEEACRTLWQRWCRGEKPSPLTLTAGSAHAR